MPETNDDLVFDRLSDERRAPGEVMVDSEAPVLAFPAQTPDSSAAAEGAGGRTELAKEQAGDVAQQAADAGARVVGTAKEEAANVTAEAGRAAKDLLGQTRDEVTAQVGDQQRRVASGLRSVTAELSAMAGSVNEPGVATDLVRQAADRVDSISTWLEQREPGDVLDDVKTFARRRPGMFLAAAAGMGLLAGRLTRGLAADRAGSTDDGDRPSRGSNGGRNNGDRGESGNGHADDYTDIDSDRDAEVRRASAYPPLGASAMPNQFTPQSGPGETGERL